MAITFPLSTPSSPRPELVVLDYVPIVATTESIFSYAQQVQEHPGERWTADVRLPVLTDRADIEPWWTFLIKLRGRSGTFLLGDDRGSEPRGAAKDNPGTPLVNGASQTGNSLVCDGAPNGVTGYLLEGDWVSLGSGTTTRLYKVMEDADTDGSGNFTLTIRPDLRESPADNDPLTLSDAKGTFRLARNSARRTAEGVLFRDLGFQAVEKL